MVAYFGKEMRMSLLEKYPMLFCTVSNYITKANENLEKKLKDEGYIEPKETVNSINSLEDSLNEILDKEKKLFLDGLSEENNIETILDEIIPKLILADTIDQDIQVLFSELLMRFVEDRVKSYIKNIDKELAFNYFCERTTTWISEWSEDLGKLMKLSSQEEIKTILQDALKNGESVNKVMDKLEDSYSFSPMSARNKAKAEIDI